MPALLAHLQGMVRSHVVGGNTGWRDPRGGKFRYSLQNHIRIDPLTQQARFSGIYPEDKKYHECEASYCSLHRIH